MRRKNEILKDLETLDQADPTVRRLKQDINNLLDDCEMCGGTQRGIPGQERIDRGKTFCRECERENMFNDWM